jgi:hypothetical protein
MRKIKNILTSVVLASLALSAFASPSLASDGDYRSGSSSVGGSTVYYYHYLSYMDERCGMNTQSHYRARAVGGIDNLGVEWDITNVAGGHMDRGSVFNSPGAEVYDESASHLVIGESEADFTYQNNGNSWTPGNRVFHCMSWTGGGLNAADDYQLNATETNSDMDLVQKFQSLNTQLNSNNDNAQLSSDFLSKDEQKNLALDILIPEREDEVNQFEFEDGTTVSLNDFEVVSSVSGEGEEFSIDDAGITMTAAEDDSYTNITLELPKPAFKDGEEYYLSAHAMLIDGKTGSFDYGIKSEVVE